MANFKQHLNFGFITTGVCVAPLIAGGYVSSSHGTLLWLCGAVGSIIPDVDSDNAIALDIIFLILSILSIYTLIDNFAYNRSGLEIVAIVIAGFSLCFFLRLLFERLSVHRGVFHSLLAAAFFGLAACVFTYYINQVPSLVAWLAGSFMVLGTLVHLLLDEIYSVDFMNLTVKRSFGTAMKLTSFKHWKASIALIVPGAALWWYTPPAAPFISVFGQLQTYKELANAMVPAGWF